MRRAVTVILFALIMPVVLAQTGGDNTYKFLNLSSSAIVTSLGGINVSLPVDDPSILLFNPALLEYSGTNRFSLNYVNYYAGINYGSAIWTGSHSRVGKFGLGLSYLNYGKFERADQSGSILGEFKAAEYAFHIIWNYRIDSLFNAGIDIKPVLSHLERYTSYGLAIDLGISYRSKSGRVSSGLVLSNLGFQIKSYTGIREKLPTTLTAGITVKPEYAPFRLSLTATHMEKYDLTHSYPGQDNSIEVNNTGINGFAENFMRHMVFGAEFLPSENFFISAGFNYQRRKELSLDYRSSTVGFSSGFGIRLTAFDLSYSRSKFHLAGSINNLSLVVKPEAFFKHN